MTQSTLVPLKIKKTHKNTQFPRFWETRAKGKLNISNETKEGKITWVLSKIKLIIFMPVR